MIDYKTGTNKKKENLEAISYNPQTDHYLLKIALKNESGIHLRVLSLIAQKAEKFKCEIGVKATNKKTDYYVNAKRLLELVNVSGNKGSELEFMAKGEKQESENALYAMRELVNSKFGEDWIIKKR